MSLAPADAVKDLAPAGTLRAAINYGNGVLAQRGPSEQEARGVSGDLARELAKRLGVPVHFVSFEGAGGVFDSTKTMPPDSNAWDIAFLAIEPARAAEIAFTAPYVLIQGTYIVRSDSALTSVTDFDRPGMRIAVRGKSAYDLFLTRTLKHSQLTRIELRDGTDLDQLFRSENVEAVGGVRQHLDKFVAEQRGFRVIADSFMDIRQAMGTKPTRSIGARYLRGFVEEMKASGFVADALKRSGQNATVAPPEA